MSIGKLEILTPFYPPLVHLRYTVNTQEILPSFMTTISLFRFNGGEWKLQYGHYGELHGLELVKVFGDCRLPFDASVQVESGGSGQIATDLSEETHFKNKINDWRFGLWRKQEYEIQRAVPEFSRNQILTLNVLLKGIISPTASVTSQSQMECIPEGFEVSCMESLSTDFDQLMAQGSNPDVVFKCAGQSIRAHGAVICARSSVFAAMLENPMIEGRTREIEIPDMEPDDFKRFLRYLYCGKLDELTYDVAWTLYECGDKYAVKGLVRSCTQFLLEHLSPNNACNILVLADLHSDRDFAEKVITYMVKATVPHVSDEWSTFCEDHPKLAVQVLNHDDWKVHNHQYRLCTTKVSKK